MDALRLRAKRLEVDNIYSFVFEPGPWRWKAGQCLGFVLPQLGDSPEVNERWFTIASAPNQGFIQVTTRISDSLFKQKLAAMEPGEEIQTHGLGGKFLWEGSGEDVILVAGGIGITPFHSQALERAYLGLGLKAKLLYFNRTSQYAFKSELDELAKEHPEFEVIPVINELITASKIIELAGEINGRTIYLSGPEPMVEAVGGELKAKGLEVKQDWFPGYDENSY